MVSAMNVRNRNAAAGFTLIEMLVGIAVLVLVGAVGVPSYANFMAERRVQVAAVNLLATLNQARSEAIKRNTDVHVKVNDLSGEWQDGWVMLLDAGKTYSACLTNPTGCLQVQQEKGRLAVRGGAALITYTKAGRLSAAVAPFELCDGHAGAAVKKRVITIDPSGRPAITVGTDCDA